MRGIGATLIGLGLLRIFLPAFGIQFIVANVVAEWLGIHSIGAAQLAAVMPIEG
jgi:hypothetical protein